MFQSEPFGLSSTQIYKYYRKNCKICAKYMENHKLKAHSKIDKIQVVKNSHKHNVLRKWDKIKERNPDRRFLRDSCFLARKRRLKQSGSAKLFCNLNLVNFLKCFWFTIFSCILYKFFNSSFLFYLFALNYKARGPKHIYIYT